VLGNEPFLVERFEKWNDFASGVVGTLFRGAAPTRGRYLFRGQRDAGWPLAPSFDRSFPDVRGKQREILETRLLEDFARQCEGDASLRTTLADPIALMALAQHHGLPTRLLDWSDSPYIAAFFAYQHALHAFGSIIDTFKGDAVAVWVLDTENYIWSERYGVQIVAPPAWDNARLYSQSGRFTLSRTPHRSLQDYVASFEDSRDALRLMTLPISEAPGALAHLDLMGINSATMFPGHDGRARAAITRIVLSTLAETPQPKHLAQSAAALGTLGANRATSGLKRKRPTPR
jgi:FRG domain